MRSEVQEQGDLKLMWDIKGDERSRLRGARDVKSCSPCGHAEVSFSLLKPRLVSPPYCLFFPC